MHNYIYYTGWWAGFGNYPHVSGIVISGMSDSCVMAHMPKEYYMQIDLALCSNVKSKEAKNKLR